MIVLQNKEEQSEIFVDCDEINIEMNLPCIIWSYSCSHWKVSKTLKLIPTEKLDLSYTKAKGFLQSHTVCKIFMLVQTLLEFQIPC